MLPGPVFFGGFFVKEVLPKVPYLNKNGSRTVIQWCDQWYQLAQLTRQARSTNVQYREGIPLQMSCRESLDTFLMNRNT